VFKSSAGGTVSLNLCDRENETSNVYSQEILGDNTGVYELTMKMEHVNLVQGDYNVKISNKLITEWKHSRLPLVYYIALEP
jgi:aspartate ammonia-lyase